MPAYFGAKQLFRNRLGGRPIREIYWGNKHVMGYTAADYNASELIGEKAHAGDYPDISGDGTTLRVMTTNYNPGYAFTRYYCDHIKITMQYSGGLSVFDIDGNEVVTITGTISSVLPIFSAIQLRTSTCLTAIKSAPSHIPPASRKPIPIMQTPSM